MDKLFRRKMKKQREKERKRKKGGERVKRKRGRKKDRAQEKTAYTLNRPSLTCMYRSCHHLGTSCVGNSASWYPWFNLEINSLKLVLYLQFCTLPFPSHTSSTFNSLCPCFWVQRIQLTARDQMKAEIFHTSKSFINMCEFSCECTVNASHYLEQHFRETTS